MKESNLKNKDIREYATKNNVCLWQVADALNIHSTKLSVMLRYELKEPEKQLILKTIKKLAEHKED